MKQLIIITIIFICSITFIQKVVEHVDGLYKDRAEVITLYTQ